MPFGQSMPGKPALHLRRTAILLPEPGIIPYIMQLQLSAAEQWVSTIKTDCLLSVCQGEADDQRPMRDSLNPVWHSLWHELSERAMRQACTQRFQAGRAGLEYQIEIWATRQLSAALAQVDAASFLTVINSIGRAVDGGNAGFRDGDVGLMLGRRGDRVTFPPAQGIAPQLRLLHSYLRANLMRHPLLAAIVGMICITNCHPFSDGNGRCSRILFNALLKIAGRLHEYIPLYELFWQCGCGYEIRVRELEITGNWEPVVEFVCNLMAVAHQLSPADEIALATSACTC